MRLVPGSRVRATRDVYSLIRVSVPSGTPGTVEQVRDFGTIVVRFDNGRRLGVSDTFLEPEMIARQSEPAC